ncbi:TonB-dependent receptor [Chitinophaga lutea]|uniref:TonB-dependent receptor n=1 Tax=Chitinophaga lutea TaxID=2488634 RepID=A0A3N4PP39_9BACT|nr:TonB-dependent receptor [Chitinophaga lutea]RPE09398.1 TonB-dependent receptor [Chitinophaga lutea]
MQKSTRRFFPGHGKLCLYICPLLFILLFGQHLVLAAQSYKSLQQQVTVKTARTSVADVIKRLQAQTSLTYVYDPLYLEQCRVPAMDYTAAKLGAVLEYLDRHAAVDIEYDNNTVAIRKGQVEAAMKKENEGTITGRVIDNRNEPLPGVTIMIEGGSGTTTGVDGSYSIQLPPGKYTLVFRYVSFSTRKVTDIAVKSRQATTLNVLMTASPSSLKEVVVTASYQRASVEGLYALQKNNAAVSDGISAEQIKATPDNNAAQVLKRVNGLTVQDDKFVTVRGLSERYNNVMMNGASLPSTEPNRRNFSFDVIPSALIDNIVVNKTATPDMPSEFAGGLVQVNTRNIPDRNFLTLTAGTGINTNSTGKTLYSTKRGGRDYLGFDDGTRRWWNHGWGAEEFREVIRSGDKMKRSEMERRIPNNWGMYKYDYSPVQNYQLAAGRVIMLKDRVSSLGITLAGTYRHEESVVNESRHNPGYYHYYFDSSRTYNFNTALGAVANIGFQTKGHRVAFKNLYNRRFSNEMNVNKGMDWSSIVSPINHYINVTLINSLLQNRLEGEHLLGKKLKLDWAADNITLDREQPDTRSSRGRSGDKWPYDESVAGQYRFYIVNEALGYMTEGINIFNAMLKERRKNVAANLSMPFNVGGAAQTLKAGYAGVFRKVDYQSQVFRLLVDPTSQYSIGYRDTLMFGKSDHELHSPEFLRPGMLNYVPTGLGSFGFSGDDYKGKQQIHAAYVMADLKLLQRFRLIGGVRMEQSNMEVTGIVYAPPMGYGVDSTMRYKKTDWLPSANLVYAVNNRMNIRAAYSKTLARAEFRERAPYIYYEFKERAAYYGAQGLKDASIDNFDLRYEYYPAPGEVISVSAFYKKFKDPVEIIGVWSGSVDPRLFYFNLRNSTNTGLELDLRKSLRFINPAQKWLSHVFVSANGSWMKAKVRYNTDQLMNAAGGITGRPDLEKNASDSRDRPLQGLSPYVINGGIGYFGDVFGVNVTYNRYGQRIVTAGFQPWEDLYENPRDLIDVQLSATLLKKKMQVRFNISDVLQQDNILYMNRGVVKSANVTPAEDPYTLGSENSDPKGTRFNKDRDYVRQRWFKGRNLSLNVTYSF